MSKSKPSPIPMRIRDACVLGFEQTIPTLVRIANSEKSPTAQIAAIDRLGKYGLGGRSELLFEGKEVVEICLQQVKETFSPSETVLNRFKKRLLDEFEHIRESATEGGNDGDASDLDRDD
jgi:hypothetical protein